MPPLRFIAYTFHCTHLTRSVASCSCSLLSLLNLNYPTASCAPSIYIYINLILSHKGILHSLRASETGPKLAGTTGTTGYGNGTCTHPWVPVCFWYPWYHPRVMGTCA